MIYKNKNGKEIKEAQDIGTIKYIALINNRYFVDFEEVEYKRGKGSYAREGFQGLNAIPSANNIILSENKKDAKIIEAKINLKSFLTQILSNADYKFYSIEIIEID